MSDGTSMIFCISRAVVRLSGWVGIVLWALSAVGCALLPPAAPPVEEGQRLAVVEAYADKIRQSESCGQFEADVKVRFDSLLKDASLSGILLAKRPQSVKFVGLSPFGQPLVIFILDGEAFLLVDVHAQKAYNGSYLSAKASEVFPFARLEKTDLYSLLSGVLVAGDLQEALISTAGVDKKQTFLLSWPTKDRGMQRVVLDVGSGRVLAYELVDAAGFVLLRFSYDGLEDQKCGLPTRITVTGEEVRGTIEIKLEEIQVNSGLTQDDFRLELPPGFRLETVR